MSILHTFPLTVLSDITGERLHETPHFKGYIPQRGECFKVGSNLQYCVQRREFYYNEDMEVIAVELYVVTV
jgi:hypothetical protein